MRRTTPGVLSAETTPPLPYPVEVIEAALVPLVLSERLARLESVASARVTSVVTVLESLVDPHNLAAILRTSDAFGVGEVHVIDGGIHPLLAQSVTRGCERWMDVVRHTDPVECVRHLTARGYGIFVADARASTTLDAIADHPKAALVFGNEHEGASPAMRALATGTYSVQMRGMVESLNVSVAAGITLHRVTLNRRGDIGPEAARVLRARFLLESVRQPRAVIERYLQDHKRELAS